MSVAARLQDLADAIGRQAAAGEPLQTADMFAIASALDAEVRLLRNAELARARRLAEPRTNAA